MKAWAQRNTGRRRIHIWLALLLVSLLTGWRLFFAGGPARPALSMDAPPVRVATALAQKESGATSVNFSVSSPAGEPALRYSPAAIWPSWASWPSSLKTWPPKANGGSWN